MDNIKVNINTLDSFIQSHDFTFDVPKSTYLSLNCKFYVQVDNDLLLAQQKSEGYLGYIMLQIEQYGYDETVNVMVQPRDKFIDYKEG
jgi:hypothetical protein